MIDTNLRLTVNVILIKTINNVSNEENVKVKCALYVSCHTQNFLFPGL
jgi:hypothetical protein